MAVVKYSKHPDRARTPCAVASFVAELLVTITPRVSIAILAACLLSLPPRAVQAQAAMPGANEAPPPSQNGQSGGWDALARLLEAAKPGVDTALPPTASQITDHIEQLLNQGRNKEALEAVEKRLADTRNRPDSAGTDVQLEFQHARALAALGRTDEAMDIYRDMTFHYPELPEPWNNIAVLYASKGDIDRAQDALQNALRADPNYAAARANLADVQLMLAKRSYGEASKLGVSGSQSKERAVDQLLKDSKHP
jgi:tetratricopeptide (TPR) repeat protein